jgi:hypothetical protein
VKLPIQLFKQTKISFLKMENERVKQVLTGGRYQWEEGGYKERV